MRTGHSSAGVGFQHDNTALVTKLDIRHDAFQRAHDNGRINHRLVVIDKNISVPVYTIYGYTGGHHNSTAALNTSQLFGIAAEENRKQGNPPAIICTDLDADPEDLNYLRDQLLAADRWLDIGARASVWGATIKPPATLPTTRWKGRGEIIVSSTRRWQDISEKSEWLTTARCGLMPGLK